MDIKYSVGDVGAFKYLQGLCCVYESGKKNSSKLSDKPRSDYEDWFQYSRNIGNSGYHTDNYFALLIYKVVKGII